MDILELLGVGTLSSEPAADVRACVAAAGKLRHPLTSNMSLAQPAFIVPDCVLPRPLMQRWIGAAIQAAIGADVVNSKQASHGR